MSKSNIDILSFVDSQPGRAIEIDALNAYIGDNAERRVSDLVHDHVLKCDSDWYGSGPAILSLDSRGDELLAAHQQAEQQARDNRSYYEAQEERHRQEAEALARINRRNVFISGISGAVVGSVLAYLLQRLFG